MVSWEVLAPAGTVAQIIQLTGDLITDVALADGMLLDTYFGLNVGMPGHPAGNMLAQARLLQNTGQAGQIHLGWGRMVNSTAAVLSLLDADDPASPVLAATEFAARLDRLRLTDTRGLQIGVSNDTGLPMDVAWVRFAALLWLQEVV